MGSTATLEIQLTPNKDINILLYADGQVFSTPTKFHINIT
jgi:hypothetical protein